MHLYGGAKQVYYLLKGLKENSFGENLLVCPKNSDISKKCTGICKIYDVAMYGDIDLLFLFKLLGIIKKEKPHIIHVHSRRGADLWGGVAAKLSKTKSVITRRVDNPESKYLLKLKYSLYDKIVSISRGIVNVLTRQGVTKKDIIVISSAIDYDFYNKDCDRNFFLREFSLSNKVKTVGMIAQFIPRKGHEFLIKAAPFIIKQVPDVVFLLFGKGPLLKEIGDKIKTSRLEKYIKVVGFRWDLEKILPCLDLIVHPASMEGLGVSLLQASSAGVPIVASAVGGIPEIVWNNENGLLFKKGDTEDFINKTVCLLKDKSLREKMGLRGKEIVRNHFSIDRMVRQYISLYSNILKG
ncbi:N-acetyl-alpha-D-glucosaminyl L-malate synthase BshA [Desulfothermus okinawensis JCM 13304]